jgi:D-arabinose 1-dehydrogenase-like Zn-dependent alcohol dehydrogenase
MSILAAVMPGPRQPVELREFPEPNLEPGSMLLRTIFSEVCGTDVHLWHGRLAGVPYPIIPGHVSVGLVDKIRGDVLGADGTRLQRAIALSFSTCIARVAAATPAQ